MALVNVNSFLAKAESKDLKIDAVRSSELYKDATMLNPSVLNCIKRFETNVKVYAQDGQDLCFTDFQLFDKDEIESIRGMSGKYKYVHVGVILIAIRAMFPNYKGKGGRVIVYDGSCIDDDKSQGFIAADEFTFTDDTCYFAIRPSHIFSTTDAHIADLLRFSIDLDCPKYKDDRELIALDIGVAYRMCNASRFLDTKGGANNWSHQAIHGCSALEYGPDIERVLSRPRIPMEVRDRGSNIFERKRIFGKNELRRSRNIEARRFGRGDEARFRSGSIRIDRYSKDEFGERYSSDESTQGYSIPVGELHRQRKEVEEGTSKSRQP
ncbi:putative 36.9 kDa movement protein [Yacon virus A]|uniref:putative 36.9 kDa movement protein n=1 Tax=Yacon virus A TaxID=1868472 RepID=UPI0008098FA6|nr:putative 36.9 kDa movement protein [Yacon virus A]ANR76371.1 putative 36.9 kDa movement protein [Yacon virus A]